MTDDLSRRLHDYVLRHFAREDEHMIYAREQTASQGLPQINLQPAEARVLQLLVLLNGAKRALEIGTLAGYSAIWIASALPADGSLLTIEKSEKHARLAREHIERAGLSGKVSVLQGAATEVLRGLRLGAPLDLVFIDADKANYPNYLAWAADNLRVGGAIVADNVFWGGRVLAPESEDDFGLREFNQTLAQHPQFASTILEIGDGIALGVKTG